MIVGLREVIEEGRARNMAIGNFNTPNLECLLAVLDAAEELDVPVIIAHAQCHENIAPLDKIGPVMVELAKRSRAKVCVHLDHGEDMDYCKRAIDIGFNSMMIDYSFLPYEENVRGTREAVEYAHARGVAVESELGALPERATGADATDAELAMLYTRPELVPDFVERTKIDALAVAFGTVHGAYKRKPVLNMDIVRQIRQKTDLPLVMHGGSGISPEEYREVIRSGIDKVNYYSYLSYAGYEKAGEVIEGKKEDYFHNLALEVQGAMKEHVVQTIGMFTNIRR